MANALEQAAQTQRIKAFYEIPAFGPLRLKGRALQQSLEET
jgi:hypothetical protein